MPIGLVNKEFQDLQTPTFDIYPDLKGNTGDRFIGRFKLRAVISITSFSFEPSSHIQIGGQNTLVYPRDPLQEGFRINDNVLMTVQNTTTGVITSTNLIILGITNDSITYSATLPTFDVTTDIIAVTTDYQNSSGSRQQYSQLFTYLNFVPFQSGGSRNSIIDSEVSRFSYGDVGNMVTTQFYDGVPSSNQSGMYILSNKITDITSTEVGTESSTIRYYLLEIEFVISGFYRQDLFTLGDCINLALSVNYGRNIGDVTNTRDQTYLMDCNTGRFDEPYNVGTQTFTMVQDIDELDYTQATTKTIKIQSDALLTTPNAIALGGSFKSLSDAYHKNKPQSQMDLSMVAYSYNISGPNTSATNPDGANYDLELSNLSIVGNELTADVTFSPNPEFITFMNNNDQGDRNMILWVKIDEINCVIFNKQVSIVLPEFENLVLDQQDFLDHGQNTMVILGNTIQYDSNTEDDIGFGCNFQLSKNKPYQSLYAQIVAYNQSTNEEFILQQAFFNLTPIPSNNDGVILLNNSTPINIQLPSTSEKRDCVISLNPTLDTPLTYGVNLYYPFINNWRYWIAQTNASTDFFPNNQVKNWVPFDNTGIWGVFVKIGVTAQDVTQFKRVPFNIADYDSNPNITQSIKIYRETTGQEVQVIIEDETNRIVCDHTLVGSGSWDQNSVWGQITIEPTESNPRFILSSVIDRTNAVNPLTAIIGSKITISYPTPDVARLEAFLNPNFLNLDNGCKITSKIKGCSDSALSLKSTTNNVQKETTNNVNKQLA